MNLVLASSSAYRRALLERLGIPFSCDSPDIDETRRSGEPPRDLAIRLARGKAEHVAARSADSLVIGSDQLAELDGEVIGKPGTPENAVRELQRMSSHTVQFITAIAVLDTASRVLQEHVDVTRVTFRALDDATIARYVELESPIDCAGAIKSEGLGIALLERIESQDPSALVGLPLIRLAQMLRAGGLDPLG